MNITNLLMGLSLTASLILLIPAASADKWKGSRQNSSRESALEEGDELIGFTPRDRALIYDYYAGQGRGGRCPPGLAKKGTHCLPPGQARKWELYRPIPNGVGYYPLPRDLIRSLPVPPRGYRYVRVANDILMIATGTAMVADAIEDIMR